MIISAEAKEVVDRIFLLLSAVAQPHILALKSAGLYTLRTGESCRHFFGLSNQKVSVEVGAFAYDRKEE